MRRRNMLVPIGAAILLALTMGLGGCITVNAPKPEKTVPADKTVTPPKESDQTASPFAIGDSVAAIWTDGNLYLATVTGASGDSVEVKYADDGSTKSVSAADVKPVVKKTWSAGDKVMAVWASGRFYLGTIESGSGTTYVVKWNDGSTPSEVTADKIIAQ